MSDNSTTPGIDFNKLSDDAHFALCLARAKLCGEFSPQAQRFREACAASKITPTRARQAILKGMQELLDLGLVEARKDGLGEWDVVAINEDRLVRYMQ